MKKYKLNRREIISLLKYIWYKIIVIIKRINNDNVWLISERGDDARDNGYFFFKYIREKHSDIKIKYVIDFNSKDYEKVKKLGECVKYGSKEHYILFITAGKLMSTHIMGYSPCMSLFMRLNIIKLVKVKGKKINLKHGITKDYIKLLDYNNSHLDMIVSAAKAENDFMIKKLHYPNDIVKLVGFARFDSLSTNSTKERKILLMPTFRKYYNNIKDFKSTDYYKVYNNLLNSEKLNEMLENNNIKLYFYPHYEFQKYLDLFSTNSDNIILCSKDKYDVQTLLISSEILVTDYSSVYFDFAYMNKPMIFFQFDYEEYRKHHYSEGYFNYKKHGFGKIVKSEKDLVKELNIILKNNSKIDEEYLKRSKSFFAFQDQNNCERIYQSILVLE